MLKYCHVCKEKKTLDCFYKDKSKKDGLHNRCKPCDNEYRKRYKDKPEGKRARIEASERYRHKYPEAWNARARVRYAVAKGKMIKPQYCERLGSTCSDFTKLQAHHYAGYDGDNWKNVIWLCSRHHHDEHLSIKRSGLSIHS